MVLHNFGGFWFWYLVIGNIWILMLTPYIYKHKKRYFNIIEYICIMLLWWFIIVKAIHDHITVKKDM